MSDDIPEPEVEVINIAFGEFETAMPTPPNTPLYSSPVEALDIPSIWFANPVVPKPVPPLASVKAVVNVKEEADKAPVNVPAPVILNPVPLVILPLTPKPPVTTTAPVVDEVEFVLLIKRAFPVAPKVPET